MSQEWVPVKILGGPLDGTPAVVAATDLAAGVVSRMRDPRTMDPWVGDQEYRIGEEGGQWWAVHYTLLPTARIAPGEPNPAKERQGSVDVEQPCDCGHILAKHVEPDEKQGEIVAAIVGGACTECPCQAWHRAGPPDDRPPFGPGFTPVLPHCPEGEHDWGPPQRTPRGNTVRSCRKCPLSRGSIL